MTKWPFIFSILGQIFQNSARDFYSTFGFHFLWHATMYEIQQFRLTSISSDFGLFYWSMLRVHGYVYSGMLQNAREYGNKKKVKKNPQKIPKISHKIFTHQKIWSTDELYLPIVLGSDRPLIDCETRIYFVLLTLLFFLAPIFNILPSVKT